MTNLSVYINIFKWLKTLPKSRLWAHNKYVQLQRFISWAPDKIVKNVKHKPWISPHW